MCEQKRNSKRSDNVYNCQCRKNVSSVSEIVLDDTVVDLAIVNVENETRKFSATSYSIAKLNREVIQNFVKTKEQLVEYTEKLQ